MIWSMGALAAVSGFLSAAVLFSGRRMASEVQSFTSGGEMPGFQRGCTFGRLQATSF